MATDDDDYPSLDETDLALLECVETDFDVNLATLAEELDLSKSAVHYRMNKLQKADVIQRVTADLNPMAFGMEMTTITNVSVTHETGYAEDIGEEIAVIPGVQQVYYTMGDVDFVVFSRLQNRSQLNELIDSIVSIDGVNETSSRFVMKEVKANMRPLSNSSNKMKDEIIDN